MGNSSERGNDRPAMGHGLGNLRIVGGSGKDRPRPPTRQAQKTAIALLFLCVMLPEVNALFKDDTIAWIIYLTANEVVKAILCFLLTFLSWTTYPLRIGTMGTGVWFLTQAVDEATNGNNWYHGRWEYVVLSVLIAAIAIIIRTHHVDEQ